MCVVVMKKVAFSAVFILKNVKREIFYTYTSKTELEHFSGYRHFDGPPKGSLRLN